MLSNKIFKLESRTMVGNRTIGGYRAVSCGSGCINIYN